MLARAMGDGLRLVEERLSRPVVARLRSGLCHAVDALLSGLEQAFGVVASLFIVDTMN